MTAMALALGLAGCGATLPTPAEVPLAAPPGLTLPVKGRAMLYVAESDLKRKFGYDLNRISREETDIKDGQLLQSAGRELLSKAFATVTSNQPLPRPHVMVRVTGAANWNRVDGSYKVTCGVNALESDGIPIGSWLNVFKATPIHTFESALPRLYAQCLRQPMEDMMRSPVIAEMARTGFPEPDPVKVDPYLRSQGFIIRGD
jgi:hypothetical protein